MILMSKGKLNDLNSDHRFRIPSKLDSEMSLSRERVVRKWAIEAKFNVGTRILYFSSMERLG